MDDLDALFLRNETVDDMQERPWASPLGVVFGQMLKARGVTVVNDPMSLVRATSKLYLEEFPEQIRPRSLVTRDPEAIEKWRRETFPNIARQAKTTGGDVYFWDESGFRADTVHGKTWGLKGQTPVIERPGQRQSISAASADVNSDPTDWTPSQRHR